MAAGGDASDAELLRLHQLIRNLTGDHLANADRLHSRRLEKGTPATDDGYFWDPTKGANGRFVLKQAPSSGGASHDPVTLDVNADGFFSLTDQELGVDPQAANVVVAGPTSGGAAIPNYRSLVVADIPANIDHTTLANIGTFTHAAIDGHLQAFNGIFHESFTLTITEVAGDIVATLDKNPTGDLTEMFSDGHSTFPSGGTKNLTAGTAIAPKKNYLFVLQSAKGVLDASDSGWPATEHIKVAEVVVQTAALVASDGILANRNWNDHVKGGSNDSVPNQGHFSHAWERLRWEHSAYHSGSAVTWTDGAALDLAITAGKVYQLHLQDIDAFDTADPDNVYVPNHFDDAYTKTADIDTLVEDSDGDPLTNKYYNLVIWCSVSSGSEEEKVFINLPSGSYNKLGDAIADVAGYDNFNIPPAFRGYAYLIQRATIKHASGGGGTWSVDHETDLRGQTPNILAGGGGGIAALTEFADSAFRVFDGADPTRVLAFQVSGVSASTTRTLTVPDASGTIALVGASGDRGVGLLVSEPGGDALTTGDGKVYFQVPSFMTGMDLVEVSSSLSTVSSSGIPTVQVRRSRRSDATTRANADMLSTKLTIDASEFDSIDAAAAAVIDGANDDVVTGDHIYIDVDVAGTGAKGLFVNLVFRLP